MFTIFRSKYLFSLTCEILFPYVLSHQFLAVNFREKARKYCQHMRKPSLSNTVNDRLVPTSTTDDLEYIIAGL